MTMPKPLNPGELRNQVKIMRKDVTLNAYNEEAITWVVFATAWAKVEPLRGREYLTAQQVQSEITTKITIRYLPGMAPAMQVWFGDQVYDVQSVIHVQERQRVMELMCRQISGEGVANG